MEKIIFHTKEKREVVDITDDVIKSLEKLSVRNGICNLFIMHTTAALTVASLRLAMARTYSRRSNQSRRN